MKQIKIGTATLIHGDCEEFMKDMPDKCIDLTVTSPPYDCLRSYNGNNMLWGVDVWKRVIKELFRITKNGGVVVWVVGDSTVKGSETGTSFAQALWAKECGFNLHDTMIYHKLCYVPLTHNRYEQAFEYMFIFSKGRPLIFNPIMKKNIRAGAKISGGFRHDGENISELHGKGKKIKDFSIKTNVWPTKTGWGHSYTDSFVKGHPAVFPESLARDHILSWSDESSTVFDPFMGACTTGKMANILKREFIGTEIDQKYFDISVERVIKSQQQQKLF